jgi:hypothetical protein
MNEQNFEYLKDNMKYLGFGENLGETLMKKLNEGLPDFSITHRVEINKKPFEAALHFRKADNADMYFLNSYSASLKRSNGDKMEHTFYVNKGKGVTAKEAYNLLEGSAVFKELSNKEGQTYKAWIQLDFKEKEENGHYKVKQFHENYGYDLGATLNNFPIKELQEAQQRERLMMSLQKGNIQGVTMVVEGKEQQFFLQANPQYKTVTIYDKGATRPMTHEQKAALMQGVDAKQKQLNGKEIKNDQPGIEKESKEQPVTVSQQQQKEKRPEVAMAADQMKKAKDARNLLPLKEGSGTSKGLRT